MRGAPQPVLAFAGSQNWGYDNLRGLDEVIALHFGRRRRAYVLFSLVEDKGHDVGQRRLIRDGIDI